MPEVGGRVDFAAEDHEQTMMALGLQSKREITRTRIRVRTAMAAQTREQGRYLGGRPPYGYRLADAGPHPNKAYRVTSPRRAGLSSVIGSRWLWPDRAPAFHWAPSPRLIARTDTSGDHGRAGVAAGPR